jgi:hypothetical protein
MLRAFNNEPLSLSILEPRRVVPKSVRQEGKEDEVGECSREMGLYTGLRPSGQWQMENLEAILESRSSGENDVLHPSKYPRHTFARAGRQRSMTRNRALALFWGSRALRHASFPPLRFPNLM